MNYTKMPMTRLLAVFMVICAGVCPSVSGAAARDIGSKPSEIDSQWLLRALKRDKTTDEEKRLVLEFLKAHPTTKMPTGKNADNAFMSPLLRIETLDLPQDNKYAYLMFLGTESAAMFYVIMNKKNSWWLIYNEYIVLHGREPELSSLNDISSTARMFYMFKVVFSGTNNLLHTFKFYAMTQDAVTPVLEVPKESIETLPFTEFNFSARTSMSEQAGGISVHYSYRVDPSDSLLKKLGVPSGKRSSIGLIRDEGTVLYAWDEKGRRFIPNFDGSRLTPRKIMCFNQKGTEDLCVPAFESEFKSLAASGTNEQKKIAIYYLEKYISKK